MKFNTYLHYYSLILPLFIFSQSILLAQQGNFIPSAYAHLFEVEGIMSDSVIFPKKIKSVLIVDASWHILTRKELRKALKAHHLATFYADSDRVVRVQMMNPPSAEMLAFMESSKQRKKAHLEKLEALKGKPAPDFSVTSLNGNEFSISALKGKTIVLNFWFVDCPPCRREIPDLNELVSKYESDNIVFIAIALDKVDRLIEFLASSPLLYNVVPDGREISKLYSVRGYPANVVIDREGSLVFQSTGVGLRTIANLERHIRKSLK